MRFIIVGGGIAGTTAAEELRKLDTESEILLISHEPHVLYSRVLLPHYLKGKIPRERVFLKKETWYQEQGIEWLAGVRVEFLDSRNKCVGLSDGRELLYDKLLVATGGDLRLLSHDKRGVSYFRSLDDADHLNQLLTERSGIARGGIYGGGFIACEYVNLFTHYGIPTIIAFRGSHFWSGVLESVLGEFINERLFAGGVEVHPQATLKELRGDKELDGFVTSSGVHPCSLLGVGIGIELEDSWMRIAQLKTGSGILCDEYLQTNLPDVYAAGDVAHFYDVHVGRHVAVGNWMNAQMQGRAVAKIMLGDHTPFSLVSSYATNVLGLEIIFIGDVSRHDADEVQLIGSKEEGGLGQLFVRGGRLIGAVLLNRNTDRSVITKLIQEHQSSDEVFHMARLLTK